MKKALLLAVFAMASITAFSQKESGFGIKGGLNYTGNGDYFKSINAAAQQPDQNVGYHVGLFGKINLSPFYIRPELTYSQTKSTYEDSALNLSKLDLPILVGLKIIGPVHIFAGPSFQYILKSEFEGININDIEKDFTLNAHFGAGVHLGKFGIDLRYERGLNENEAKFINSNITNLPESRIDTRNSQLILSLSLTL